jgi:CubicO group peptidase (beta-lactamase class C family)
MRAILLALVVVVTGCSGLPTEADAGLPDAAVPDGAVADAGEADAGAPDAGAADRWEPIRQAVHAAAIAADAGLSLVVYDATDAKVLEVSHGAFTPDTRVAVASASKLIAGLVIFDVIRAGQLGLGSTTGAVLGWTGPNAAITLEHLLSFTSGLPPEAPCTFNPLTTLEDCVATLEALTPLAAPGTRFDYGSTHLQIAGRMAEVATGKTWAELFSSTLRVPLGLSQEVAWFTFPRQGVGSRNPLLAGGLRASMNEYAPMLKLAFHRGTLGPVTVGTPALFDAQAREPFRVVIGGSPVERLGYPFRYGLTSWLECATPETGCQVLSSPGAFGFTPWYDREAGYVAILGMEVERAANTEGEGVVNFAVALEQRVQPLIRAALAP